MDIKLYCSKDIEQLGWLKLQTDSTVEILFPYLRASHKNYCCVYAYLDKMLVYQISCTAFAYSVTSYYSIVSKNFKYNTAKQYNYLRSKLRILSLYTCYFYEYLEL